MLQVSRFDLKTGLALHETIEGVEQPKIKQIEHSYLEHWLQESNLSAQFQMGKFYDGVNDLDRLRLEDEGKVLVFTNGEDGYFTDPDTAQLMTAGDPDRRISPIYAGDRNSPHNFVAYGSLVASDGISSTSLSDVRILVIDDERRTHGDTPLIDMSGTTIVGKQLEKLYPKMGDGTMLVPPTVMRDLMTPEECDEITARVFEKAGISNDITTLAQDTSRAEDATQLAERLIDRKANQTVTQFRAATPALPGMIKGTMASSRWCERLGVDAIISKNDIKGDDGRLSSPGIKTIPSLWLNRKSDGRYGEQAVGPQVKGCIPEATLHEFNPRMKAQAEELAAVVADPTRLSQYYVQQKERQRDRIPDSAEFEDGPQQPARPDWLYDVLKADEYGQLASFSKINKELNRYVKNEWLENAVRGIAVPSAMAQHHSQLKPWEVCNKDLAHGAIVAYYRSPFPNVGAAAIAINNTEVVREQDREAFSKQGVAYLNPWTAKNIAITDFDRDANGFFVGYQATVPDLPQQIRQQLASVETLPPAQQYEAWRSLSEQMVEQMEQGQEQRIAPADYPLAVKEFIERNAPDVKPPEITKQKKVKHPWEEAESHSSATWRAFEKTADNPTGRVANAGMTLQSFALEMQYAPEPQRQSLLLQISDHLSKQMREGKLAIPGDAEMQAKGFPAYHFEEQIKLIARARPQLAVIEAPQERQQFIHDRLKVASGLLSDIVNGPNAANLQAAVDTAKSAVPIDEGIHRFTKAFMYKEHELRKHQKDPSNYTGQNTLANNTQEPIGYGVKAVNQIYEEVHLPELKNEAYKDLFPKNCTTQQQAQAETIARTYNGLIDNWRVARDRLQERHPEDQQPTLAVTTPGGRQLTLQGLPDSSGDLPIWRAAGIQPDWKIHLRENEQKNEPGETEFSAHLSFPAQDGTLRTELLGYLSSASIDEHGPAIAAGIQAKGQELTLPSPVVQIQAPFAQQNDVDEMLTRATNYAKTAVESIPQEERLAYLSATWRQSHTMGFAMKQFTEEICDRLQSVPEIRLTGIQYKENEAGQIPPGKYAARFSELTYTNRVGQTKTSPSIAIVAEDGGTKHFGVLDARSLHLPLETTVIADITIDENGKTAKMQVLELADPAKIASPLKLETDSSLASRSADDLDQYSPSRGELLEWYKAERDCEDIERLGRIIDLGVKLRDLFRKTQASSEALPPLDFRHSEVSISSKDRLEMNRVISAQAFAEPEKKEVEVG